MIELLIVIAIIAILAGIMSIVISGFVRDARMETLNNQAQLVYSGFQTMVSQCEIKQDDSLFFRVDDATHTASDVSGAIVYFHIAKGGNGAAYERQRVGNQIEVINVFSDLSVVHGNAYKRDDSDPARKKAYEKIEKAIVQFIPESVDGTYAVYIDYANYEVSSVVCRALNSDGTDPTIGQDNLKQSATVNGYYYYGLNNTSEQKAIIKNKGIYYGVYPYAEAVGATLS